MTPEQYVEKLDQARKDLIAFAILTDERYKPNWHHEALADELMDTYKRVQRGERVRKIIEMPPRHGKSELSTIKFPAWCMGKDSKFPVIISSYSSDLAEDFGGKCRNLVQSRVYKDIFPDSVISYDTRSKSKWSLTRGGELTAVGVGGPITGRGGKIAIIDDPIKNAEEAASETIREKIWEWYKSTLYTRLEGAGAIIIIMTRWHLDDLVGRVLQQEEADKTAGKDVNSPWEIVRFPAVAEQDEVNPYNGELYRREGEALWPAKFNAKELRAIEQDVGPDVWFSLYQQNPIAVKNATFKKDFFRYYRPSEIENKNLLYYTVVDLATSQKKRADNSVITTIAKERDGHNIYRIEETAGKFLPEQIIDAIFMHYNKYHSQVFIEVVAAQKLILYPLKEEMIRRGIFFMVNEMNTNKEKEGKIKRLQPLYQNGYIHHKLGDTLYEKELLEFPNGQHDDRIDAMSMVLDIIPQTAIKRKRPVEETHQVHGNYTIMKRGDGQPKGYQVKRFRR